MIPGDPEFHPGVPWVIEAVDCAKAVLRTFDPAHIHRWEPQPAGSPIFATPTPGRAAEPDTMGEGPEPAGWWWMDHDGVPHAAATTEQAHNEATSMGLPFEPLWKRGEDSERAWAQHRKRMGEIRALQDELVEARTRAEPAEAQLATLRAALTKIVAVADKDSIVDAERLSDIRSVTRSALLSTSGADR